MEYSIISMFDYYKDTLSNVGLPESWLNRSRMMWLKLRKCVKTELNGGEKTESNLVKNRDSDQVKHGESNTVKHGESNQVKYSEHRGTADVDYDTSVRYLTAQWSGYWQSGRVITVIVKSADHRHRRRRSID